MTRTLAVLAAAMLSTASANLAEAADKPVSIVLVHGAFVDGSGWQKVYEILSKDGYEVLVVQNSTATLDGDVAATEQVIARAKHPVILVGHSYGGAVITEAGNDPKVQSLVYLAAFAPEAGESVETLVAEPVPGVAPAPILPLQDGSLIVDPAKFPSSFAADVDLMTTTFMAASQTPWGKNAVATKIQTPAWKKKATYFMITSKDHMIPTVAQLAMAKRAKATSIEIDSSHAVMLSHPQDVAKFIESASAAL
jgi:pimeloyl-ACP methyl ester carboxylesterase